MSFWKKIFGIKRIEGGPFFTINKKVISDPYDYSVEAAKTIRALLLTDKEIKSLYDLCDILQERIERHYEYILETKYTIEKLQTDNMLLFKSYFELTSMNWVIITNHFKQHNVRDEVGHALWWIMKYSFWGHEGLFAKSPLQSFENALQSREELYARLLSMYFKPRQLQVYQNMFEIIIDRPLTDKTDEVDMIMSFSDNFFDKNKLPNSVVFNKYISNSIKDVHSKLSKIEF